MLDRRLLFDLQADLDKRLTRNRGQRDLRTDRKDLGFEGAMGLSPQLPRHVRPHLNSFGLHGCLNQRLVAGRSFPQLVQPFDMCGQIGLKRFVVGQLFDGKLHGPRANTYSNVIFLDRLFFVDSQRCA